MSKKMNKFLASPMTGLYLIVLVALIGGAVLVFNHQASSNIQPSPAAAPTAGQPQASSSAQPVTPMDKFAQCLSDKGAVMYGAKWCPHCQNEKKGFGDSFRFIKYVECPDNPKQCLDVGIESYPTWIFPDGKKLVGEQGVNKLAKESGCNL